MTAQHYLRHLVLAYNELHPADEHYTQGAEMPLHGKEQLKAEILTKLADMEARCDAAIMAGEDLTNLKRRMQGIRKMLNVPTH
ncbi:hypothetical protein HYX10_03070 [Candidatus Woesearchaeota archaeon]|nr:hypothetical protein [Candidatus Woesearchaeota archaeon]